MDTWGRPTGRGRGHREPRDAPLALPTPEDTSATSKIWIWGEAREEPQFALHTGQRCPDRPPTERLLHPQTPAQEEPPAQRRAHRCVPKTRVAGVHPLFPESQEDRRRAQPCPPGRPAPARDSALSRRPGWEAPVRTARLSDVTCES